MGKIMDVKKIFPDAEIVEAIRALNLRKRPAQISTIFQELNKGSKYSQLHDGYLELAEKLSIMRIHNVVTWDSTNPKHLGASETVRLVEGIQ